MLQLHVVLQLHAGFNSLHTGVLTLFSAPRLQFFLPSICELGNKTKRNQKSASCFPRKTGKNQSSAVVSPYEIAVSVPVLVKPYGERLQKSFKHRSGGRGRSLHNPLRRDRTEGRGAGGFEKSLGLGLRSAGRVQTTPCSTACVGSTRENESDDVFTSR